MTVMPLAMEKVGEPIVNESERIVSNVNDMEREFDPAKPFSFEIEYETTPPIVWKKNIKETKVVLQDNGDLLTDVAATEDLINGWRKQKGGFQRVVVGRGLEKGDTCIMDLDIRAKGLKASLPGMKKQRFPFDSDMDPLGLVQGMAGRQSHSLDGVSCGMLEQVQILAANTRSWMTFDSSLPTSQILKLQPCPLNPFPSLLLPNPPHLSPLSYHFQRS
jgi:hypothetical protein